VQTPPQTAHKDWWAKFAEAELDHVGNLPTRADGPVLSSGPVEAGPVDEMVQAPTGSDWWADMVQGEFLSPSRPARSLASSVGDPGSPV
jgi:hypothetical protein